MMQNKENESIGDKVNNFIQKNRKGIFITVGIILVLFIGMIAYLYIGDYFNKKSIAQAEELSTRFTDMQLNKKQGMEFSDESSLEAASEVEDALLADLEAYIAKTSPITEGKGFAQGKVWSLIGHIYSDRKEWQKAEEAWLNAARKGSKTYIGPVALFNAAVAAEEQGKQKEAIDLLEQCISHKFDFPSAPRAQFNIGRLNEQLGNLDEALAAYRAVLTKWPNLPIFQYFAQNQIIKIEQPVQDN
jgi:tetratricopeptide (TPR) repeat protein